MKTDQKRLDYYYELGKQAAANGWRGNPFTLPVNSAYARAWDRGMRAFLAETKCSSRERAVLGGRVKGAMA